MSLQIGDAAPDFTLPDQNGDPISLASLRGKKVVLYFYPKDDTPGCTKEACNFRDRWEQLKANNITVLGHQQGRSHLPQQIHQQARTSLHPAHR